MEQVFMKWLRTQKPDSLEQALEAMNWFKSETRRESDNPLVRGFAKWLVEEYALNLPRDTHYHKRSREAARISQEARGIDPILVQLPMDIDEEKKREMHKELLEEYPGAFVMWRTERNMLGGLRMFVKGTLIDNSWRTRVKQLLNV